jgi:hypothetical protein
MSCSVVGSRSARCSMTPAAYTLARMSPTCLGGNGSAGGIPRLAAIARSPRSVIRTATAGCSRRSRRGCPGASTQRQQPSHRRTIWRARFGAPRPHTASTRSGSAGQIRTGPTGTPNTWWRSRLGRSCRLERRRRHRHRRRGGPQGLKIPIRFGGPRSPGECSAGARLIRWTLLGGLCFRSWKAWVRLPVPRRAWLHFPLPPRLL